MTDRGLKTDPAVSSRLQLPVAQFRGILTKSQDNQRKDNRSTPWKEIKECNSQPLKRQEYSQRIREGCEKIWCTSSK